MPTTISTRTDPGDVPGVEARLHAELGRGSLPVAVRQAQLARLQALVHELGPAGETQISPATSGVSQRVAHHGRVTGVGAPRAPVAGDSHGSAAQRARRRWSPAVAVPQLAAASTAVFAVLVLGAGSAVAASTGSLPGEALHPVKRAVEQIRVEASWTPGGDIEAHLDTADARLEEAGRLVSGEGDLAELPVTLGRHEAALDAASDRAADAPELAAAVREATVAATARLAQLADALPDTASPQAREALLDAQERLEGHVPSSPQRDPGEQGSGTPDSRPNDTGPGPVGPGEGSDEPTGSPPDHGTTQPRDGDQAPSDPDQPGDRDAQQHGSGDAGDAPQRDDQPDGAGQPAEDGSHQRDDDSGSTERHERDGGLDVPGDDADASSDPPRSRSTPTSEDDDERQGVDGGLAPDARTMNEAERP